jgi:phosphomevalonate kinase
MTHVRAPGKMVLTGAYAVLRGAPALVVAVSRGAIAASGTTAPASREVVAALGMANGPAVDTCELFDGDRKLGLGASAAGLVATLGVLAVESGDDLARSDVRHSIFARARAAHAQAQKGGSGIDVAASVYGGTLSYRLEGDVAIVGPRALPEGVRFAAYASQTFARTTDLRERVDALRGRDPELDSRVFATLSSASRTAHAACVANDGAGFLASARAFGKALEALGRAADAPIVSAPDAALARLAEASGSAFFPSGAGGGDVAVLLFSRASQPSENFDDAARRAGMVPLGIVEDPDGVRTLTPLSD